MNLTGQQIPFSNAQAADILAAHGNTEASQFMHASGQTGKQVSGDGVQPWSKGELYPGVITVVEDYSDEGLLLTRKFNAQYKQLSSGGHATRELAEAWIIGRKHEDQTRTVQEELARV